MQTMRPAQMVTCVRAQIFPVQADRWIAVVGAPGSTFVTESRSAAGVASQIRHATQDTLGWVPQMDLVDDRGRPWTPGQARVQLARMRLSDRTARTGAAPWFTRVRAWLLRAS